MLYCFIMLVKVIIVSLCFFIVFLHRNYKLFYKGYINFDNKGKIKISSFLEDKDLKILNISPEVKLINIESKHIEYLEYHREHCFIG